ncbi:11049_t:CDS:2, partial [Cetraspora pellucida]
VQGIKVAILQRLLILANKSKKEIDEVKIVGETVAEEWFKDKDFYFDCGEDRTTTVHIHVPKEVRTIRNTALFEVVCYVVVSLYLGPFTKDLTVHLPVNIAHSASLQPVPLADADLNVFPNHYNMMDENTDFFVEDIRKDDSEILGITSSPMNIPSKNGRVLPWSSDDEEGKINSSSSKGSAISYILGSVSPKGLGSLAQSLLGKQKQMSPPTPSKLIAKSQPLAPASPYAYIPAIERVRYLSFTTQEQGAIQKKPFDKSSKSIISGFGYYDGPYENSPSEF